MFRETLNMPKEMNVASTKVMLLFFPLIYPFALFIFTLSCLGMFCVHVMHVMNTNGYKGVCNILLGMLCEVTSAKHVVLYEVMNAKHT
jgi:uncharacterized membrane protein